MGAYANKWQKWGEGVICVCTAAESAKQREGGGGDHTEKNCQIEQKNEQKESVESSHFRKLRQNILDSI